MYHIYLIAEFELFTKSKQYILHLVVHQLQELPY